MKMLAAALATCLALAWSGSPVAAAEGQPGYRTTKQSKTAQRAKHKKTARASRSERRDCGLRDHSAPLGSLSDRCNVEEFWQRMQDLAPSPE